MNYKIIEKNFTQLKRRDFFESEKQNSKKGQSGKKNA